MDFCLSICSCLKTQSLAINGRRLRIIKLLGEGGFSYVYLVEDQTSGEQLALKKIRCPFGAESVANAMREVEATKTFNSPLVISQVDSQVRQEPDGGKIVYILLPFYRKGSLQDLINNCAVEGTYLDEEVVVSWAKAVAQSLRVMHRHRASGPQLTFEGEQDALLDNAESAGDVALGEVVAWAHRDVKPANVMIDDTNRAVLMDLGSCAPARIDVQSRQQALSLQDLAAEQCTLPYRAPELFDVKVGTTIDEKVDIWSYGCTIFALMYLISPFEMQERDSGANLPLAIQNRSFTFPAEPVYSDKLKNLIDKCLALKPTDRPSIDDILDDLS